MSEKVKARIKMMAMAVAVIASILLLWKEHKACSKVGGTLVRTSFWVACVDELK